ncbi:MAG TPA: hypothetical protein VIG03_00725 [Steroidobacteraceae bacterium]|jgi:hypothetical protein
MNRQQPLALAPPAGGADWSEQSLLDAGTRRALGSINLAFLDLAGELAEEGRLKQIAGLPPRAIDSLIDPEAGPRLCERLPYALFDIRFSDGNFWAAEIAAAGGVQDAGSSAAIDERIVSFTRAAIMVLWHLAQTRAACARLVFGASPVAIAALAAMPVAGVLRLARRVAPALSARFGSRARYWLQFEGCAARPDDQSVNLLRQLGLQIQGAESARGQALQRRHRRAAAG